jgi:CheY-like chemotaxis protein
VGAELRRREMSEHKSPSLLVVEDDAFVQGLYEGQLKAIGYEVRLAGDGEEALRAMQKSPPDLVLLDLVLPRLSGYDVLARMRDDPALAHVPVIMLSNKGEPADIEKGLALGATDYLVKTTTPPKQVIEKITRTLESAAAPRSPMLIGVRQGELDAARLAQASRRPPDLRCAGCREKLVLELAPQENQSDVFDARLICPTCDKDR